MNRENNQKIKKKTLQFIKHFNTPPQINLTHVVRQTLKKRKKLLDLARRKETPFFAYDRTELIKSVKDFSDTFSKHIPNCEVYYAMKANPYKNILQDVAKLNLGLDASSGLELQAALRTQVKKVLFTGPAKTIPELEQALRNNKKVVINIDSFMEVEKLNRLQKKYKKKIRVGIRIHTSYHGKWNKFGIKLQDLSRMWNLLKKNPYLAPVGIQVHMSWNENSKPYENIIQEIGKYINRNPELKKEIRFIDLGGGFLTSNSEGVHFQTTVPGKITSIVSEYLDLESKFSKHHYSSPAVSLESYAKGIGFAIRKYLPDLDCIYYFEPGRIISNNAMHIVLHVEDIKDKSSAITDGGTNMIGWERFEEEYFPIVNMTNPSLREKSIIIFGSLCTPHDIWGFYCHMSKIKSGDVLVIPNQGAYTYTYAQHFIKPFPVVYSL